jgi:hypothetical protein
MATVRSGLTQEGSLYELLARGNKDAYFFLDDFKAKSPFDNRYLYTPAQVHELRRIPPLNAAEFGRISEWEFEVAGDVFVDPTILIQLPTWIPTLYAPFNSTKRIVDANGVSYGYTNGIAYFLFQNIQIYQDQVLLQEFSGDALYAATKSRGSLSSAFLENAITGVHSDSALNIGRNATPGYLRLHLPFIGCQGAKDGGFPSIGVRSQTFKLRVTLRKLEDLVQASDARAKPVPWDRDDFRYYTSSTSYTTFSTLTRTSIGAPTLQLETRHIYLDPDTQDRLRKSDLEIPYSRLYENTFTFGAKDFEPLRRNALAVTARRVDAVHPASRLLFWFQDFNALRANRYFDYASDISGNEYYNNVSLIIAGRDRESLFPPLIWNKLQSLAKEDRDPGAGLGIMNWDLGDIRGRQAPYTRQPEGSVNFSTADRPTLYVDLANISNDLISGQQQAQMKAIVDTWGFYEVNKGRGGLRYAN